MLKMAQAMRSMFPTTHAVARQVMKAAPVPSHMAVLSRAAPLAQSRAPSRALTSSHIVRAAAADVAQGETFTYQAEVDRLMDMIVNSLYSNREVFIRELISNASDALDKARINSLTDASVLSTGTDLEIRIKCDKDAKTITIEDTGIGMTKDDLLSSLGTIARSGTAKFAQALKDAKAAGGADANLIGQFGVGFYSSFLVADRVTVASKNNADKQWVWESEAGSHQFSIREAEQEDLSRGTRITLHLKEDCEEFLDPAFITRLIKQYSEFISFPIKLWATDRVPKKVVDEAATKKAQEAADKEAEKEGKEPTPVEPVMKTEYEETMKYKVQNENKPIWTRTPAEVTDDEYNAFFKQTFKEFVDPMARAHFNVEGTVEFTGLLFVPGMAPFEQMDPNSKKSSIRLFVKRVFISDQFDEQLLPRYLGFIKGIVDSSDLPLNVSREILQESRVVRLIRKQMVKRAIQMVGDLAKKGDEAYENFWTNFGRNIKLGVLEDTENKSKLAALLRYKSSKSGDVWTGLEDYISRMQVGQKAIYFVAAESETLAANSPFVEKLSKKGIEVLYMTEPIDEWTTGALAKFKDYDLVDVSKDELNIDDDDKQALEAAAKELKGLTDFIQEELGEKVSKVTVSSRLTDSPCILVTSKHGWSANMQRIMKSQPMGDNRGMEFMKGDKTMELNPDHSVVKRLKSLLDQEGKGRAREVVNLMYETALLTSGFDLTSPKDFAGMVYDMMDAALSSGDAPAASQGGAVEADAIIEEGSEQSK